MTAWIRSRVCVALLGLVACSGAERTAREHARSLGFVGCSMAANVAQGYQALGGARLWPPYDTGALVVQSWTNRHSIAWRRFERQARRYGKPRAVWVQICIYEDPGVTYDEVKQMIALTREHALPGATIYVTGQPLYAEGQSCSLAGKSGPQSTDELAKRAVADPALKVIYPGAFGPLQAEMVEDGCHANGEGQRFLGEQAARYFGK